MDLYVERNELDVFEFNLLFVFYIIVFLICLINVQYMFINKWCINHIGFKTCGFGGFSIGSLSS